MRLPTLPYTCQELISHSSSSSWPSIHDSEARTGGLVGSRYLQEASVNDKNNRGEGQREKCLQLGQPYCVWNTAVQRCRVPKPVRLRAASAERRTSWGSTLTQMTDGLSFSMQEESGSFIDCEFILLSNAFESKKGRIIILE
ncbi:unnamed protein product [Protopolystoma xenopodis]|uniref:Uncharacterized protein n=1 Tax=Protopolystoma xenopodis TaxID=117903 RepID=A0A448WKZ1_9PLAT|nr:unnamed protein product [Protopolystoma xenopodis]